MTLPFEVAALNEPMAVARHCVNRSQARTADKVVVFGAGPIGLGAVIWLKLRGVRQVAVADVIPGRLRPRWPPARTRSSTPPAKT